MDLKQAYTFASKHRKQIEQSERCSCFHCLATFAPSEINEWIDGGDTAICPKCGVDAVLGSASGVPFTLELMSSMQIIWF
jgi:NAD-dependent SIR2 family protein deacetylase